jgi:hypothetical protein
MLFWPGKKVEATHKLVLIPETIRLLSNFERSLITKFSGKYKTVKEIKGLVLIEDLNHKISCKDVREATKKFRYA